MSCYRCVLSCGLKSLFRRASKWNFFRSWYLMPDLQIRVARFLKIQRLRDELTMKPEELPKDVLAQRVAFGWRPVGAMQSRKRPRSDGCSTDDDDEFDPVAVEQAIEMARRERERQAEAKKREDAEKAKMEWYSA